MEFWCNKGLTITVTGPEGRREIRLQQPFARIGNHAGSEVVLDDIEKRSLYLHATDEGLFCLDLRDAGNLGATSGGQWLSPEAQLKLGNYSVSAAVDPQPSSAWSAPSPPTARGTVERPFPAFRITCKSGPKARYKLSRALTVVGRDVKAGLNLYGSLVSAPHCILYCRNGRVWCVDLLSGNGTLLNGERWDRFEVLSGQQLQVGEFRLTYSGLSAQSQNVPQSADFAGGAPLEDVPVEADAGLAQPLAGAEEQVEDIGTVRLGKGDTVTVPPEIPARPEIPACPSSDVAASPPAPVILPEADSSVSASPAPVAAPATPHNSWAVKAAEQESRSNQLSRDVHVLQKMWEEQQTQIFDLRQTLTTSREQWQSEINELRQQLKAQVKQIHRLEAELSAARTMFAQQLLRAAATSAGIPEMGPIDECPQPDGDSDRAERETVVGLDAVFPTVAWQVQKIDAAEEAGDRRSQHDHVPPLLDRRPTSKLP